MKEKELREQAQLEREEMERKMSELEARCAQSQEAMVSQSKCLLLPYVGFASVLGFVDVMLSHNVATNTAVPTVP